MDWEEARLEKKIKKKNNKMGSILRALRGEIA
jgi:hypothetical protein